MELEKILENENGKVYLDYEYLKGKILKKYPNLVEVKYYVESYDKILDFEPDISYVSIMFIDKKIVENDVTHTYRKNSIKSYGAYSNPNLMFSMRQKASIILNDSQYLVYARHCKRYAVKVHPLLLGANNGITKEELNKFLTNIVYRLSKTKQDEITKIKNKYLILKGKLQNNEALSETELEFISTLMDKSENIETGYQTILKMSLERNRK